MKRRKTPVRRVPMKRITDKTARNRVLFKPIRDEVVAENPECAMKFDGCTFVTTQVHHSKGRGIYFLIKKFLIPCCDNCHKVAEANPSLAMEKGFTQSRLNK